MTAQCDHEWKVMRLNGSGRPGPLRRWCYRCGTYERVDDQEEQLGFDIS